jgi:hypothetical protein
MMHFKTFLNVFFFLKIKKHSNHQTQQCMSNIITKGKKYIKENKSSFYLAHTMRISI